MRTLAALAAILLCAFGLLLVRDFVHEPGHAFAEHLYEYGAFLSWSIGGAGLALGFAVRGVRGVVFRGSCFALLLWPTLIPSFLTLGLPLAALTAFGVARGDDDFSERSAGLAAPPSSRTAGRIRRGILG